MWVFNDLALSDKIDKSTAEPRRVLFDFFRPHKLFVADFNADGANEIYTMTRFGEILCHEGTVPTAEGKPPTMDSCLPLPEPSESCHVAAPCEKLF